MKICFVGPANSSHIVKWCNWFNSRGHEIHVVSFTDGIIPTATIHLIDLNVDPNANDYSKLKYLFAGRRIKSIVDDIKPDVINVHYATSYGAAVALSGIEKYIVSVWGSDVYDFPKKSFFHEALLRISFHRATALFSTSRAMAVEAAKYTNKSFDITPFGVDVTLFNPNKRNREDNTASFIVGTVKGLSDKYGIRHLLEAVAIISSTSDIPIKLRIAGKGPQEEEYKELAKKLGIDSLTTWLGFINQEAAAKEWANMDVAIIPSESESFGVSAVEAESSGTAVIITNIPGLMEATKPGYSSIVVERSNPQAIALAIDDLYNDPDKRNALGANGRKVVLEKYEINMCFEHIETLFYQFLES